MNNPYASPAPAAPYGSSSEPYRTDERADVTPLAVISFIGVYIPQQKSFGKIAGIATIVMIVLYGIFIVGFMVVGMAAMGRAT